MKINSLKPKLRFLNFSDNWEVKRLEKLFIEFRSGNNITSSEISDCGKYPVYGGNGKRGYFDHFTHDGDYFLIGRQGALCGNINRSKGKAYFSEHAIACRANDENNTEWLAQRLDYFNLNRLSESSAQPGLSVSKLLRYKLIVPSLPEQQKIASFLTSVDDKIALLNRQADLLKEYKKGLMQKIFSQEIRFKQEDGSDFPDWEEKRLGKLFSFISTNSFSRDKLNYEKGEVYNIHYGDIHKRFSTLFEIDKQDVPFLNSEIDVSKFESKRFCKEGDVIIADASEDYLDIGKSIECVKLNGHKVLAGLHTIHARPIKDKFCIGFFGHLTKSVNFRKQICFIAQGTKVLSISAIRLSKLILAIPGYSEQQKIANFLTSIDYKIGAINQQIEQTKTFKKGLLQQMFV